jgi:rhodanese-related sulfurtransferase
MEHISAQQLKQWLSDASRAKPTLLDVREPWEYALCHIEGSLSMPMQTLAVRHKELDTDAAVVVICHLGIRSFQVARFLEHTRFSKVYNLRGGVEAWAKEADPTMPRY